MATKTDTHTMRIVDLPLIQRLKASGTVLDSELGFTRDARGPNSLLLSSLLFPRGVYTLVARSETQPVVGQIRYRSDDQIAHIVYIAPSLDDNTEDTVWLHILDAMAREAGKHGAHSLVAEIEITSNLFETLRTAGFATYARQMIWRHEPIDWDIADDIIELEEANNDNQLSIMSLIANTIPPILQQVTAPPSDMDGLVYRKDGRIEAFIGISEGTDGVYLLPFIHPDMLDRAAEIITATIVQINRARKVPIYVCIRTYQAWLNHIMKKLKFEEWIEQAVMVKQIAVGIRYPEFERVTINGKLKVTSNVSHYCSVALSDAKDKDSS